MTAAAENYNDDPISNPQLSMDTLSYRYISDLQQRFKNKLYNPESDETAYQRLLEQRQQWRDEGALTVFTSGVYDMLHLDHAGYLLHTKATGAAEYYKRQGFQPEWETVESQKQEAFTNRALSSGVLKLIVSVDGDQSVSTRKGFTAEKGGGPRPICSWETRALTVASQSFIDPIEDHRLLPTVDAVTIHGPQDFETEHPHASLMSLVEQLQPDVWAIFGESQDILDEAPTHKSLGSIALRCIMDGQGTHYYEDRFMGKISTTKIIKRIMDI